MDLLEAKKEISKQNGEEMCSLRDEILKNRLRALLSGFGESHKTDLHQQT
jgi:hypothetical protein